MTLTTHTETRRTSNAVVTVRVPAGADGDLATETERQLSRADGVTDVTVEGLRGLQPGLSATTVTVAVTVERTRETDESTVDDALASLTGVEQVGDPSA